jgi:DNA polymerase I-like protein with 3'-5' exonuclease and polymerase domains
LTKWENLNLNVNIISNNKNLEDLKNKIKNYKKVFFDTETTSLNIYDANLVGISIFLDDENIFYINYLHG